MIKSWPPVIHMQGITRVFSSGGVDAHVLNGVDLEINTGEYVSIIGPSGCGKSTLLAIMGLMDSPTEGVYHFNGKPVQTLNPSARAAIRNQEIGFVFQNFNLIGDMSVFENVEQPLAYQKMKSADRKVRVNEALKQVGMIERANRRPSQLSGGEQQRVAVARALVGRPQILLADEPTGNLDSANGEAIMKMLRELHQSGTTICMVTHDPRFVHMADKLVHMLDGKLTKTEEGQWASK